MPKFRRRTVLSFRIPFRTSLGAMALLGVSACGGGGGGGSQGNANPLVYAGNVDPAIISTSNAGKLISNVFGSDSGLSILGEDSDDRDGAEHAARSGFVDLARRVRGFVPRDALLAEVAKSTGRATSLKIHIDETEPRGDGYVRTFGNLSDFGLGVLTVLYVNCTIGDQTLDGRASLRIDKFDLNRFAPTDVTESFARLTLVDPSFDGVIGGSVRIQDDLATNVETVTTNLVTLENNSGLMTKTENLVFEDAYDSISFPSRYSETMHGRSFDSVDGYVDVTTVDPLVFSTIDQVFPNPGGLLLAGAPSQRIQLTALSSTRLLPELDLDGDGTFESWTTILWSDLSGGDPLDFLRPSAPVVTATVNSDRSVTLDWTASTDENGILEYRLQRGTMPIGRTTETTFTDRGVEPGSLVDYIVRAVDGRGNLSDLQAPQSVAIPSAGSASFAAPIDGVLDYSSGSGTNGIAVADVDGDGTRDLIATGGGSAEIVTALGPFTAGFSCTASPVIFATMVNDQDLPSFWTSDLLGDAHPEALGAESMLAWDPVQAVWQDALGGGVTFPPNLVAFLDADGDGVLDTISCSDDLGLKFSVTYGVGDGSYDASSNRQIHGLDGLAGPGVGPIVAADFDRDGLTDLAIWDLDTIHVARQVRPRSFAFVAALPAISCIYFRVGIQVADVTGDGFPEILYADYSGTSDELRVYLNDGEGGFDAPSIASGATAPWDFLAGDLDGDQVEDLAVLNQLTTAIDLYRSNGDGTFTLLSSIANSGFPKIALADVDLDGDIDIAVGDAYGREKKVSIYSNQ